VKFDMQSLLPLIFHHHQTWLTFTSMVSITASTYSLWRAVLLEQLVIIFYLISCVFTAYTVFIYYFCWSHIRSWLCIFPIALCMKSKILCSFTFLLQTVLNNHWSECYLYIK
jgi:hypothetical protein